MISNDMAALARDLERVVRELRRFDRAGRGNPPAPTTPVDAARALAQQLADATADAWEQPRRVVPRLAEHAVADQVAVTTRELFEATAAGRRAELGAVRDATAVVRDALLEH